MFNALVALRKVVKRYEYKMKAQRGPMNEIVQTAFPVLQRLMVQILDHPQLEAAQVMHQCLKIFWSATMYSLPEVSANLITTHVVPFDILPIFTEVLCD